ncbi:hypothetical protein M885DRAFT_191145 [Pelagophyceae sp. CCMP2097]|nr:hypothetical protein M885DRAFT_191145 [Pelagophyceae sp. CCMP2097]
MFARVLLVALAATAMRLEPVEPFEEAQEMTCDDALTLAKVEEKSATEDAQFEAAYVKFSSCEKERQAVQEAMQRAQPRAKRFTRPKPTFVERQIRELKKMAPKIVSTLGVRSLLPETCLSRGLRGARLGWITLFSGLCCGRGLLGAVQAQQGSGRGCRAEKGRCLARQGRKEGAVSKTTPTRNKSRRANASIS